MTQQTIVVLNGTSRTFKHLIPQALAKGHKVRAVVRSASRFLSQTKKEDDLSVHEWSDFSDLTTLATILDGVNVIYLAYGVSGKACNATPALMIAPSDFPQALYTPSWLNEDVAISIGTVLRNTVPPGSRSPTKLVILVSYATRPGEPRRALAETLIGNQFNDLRAAQDYLTKQSSWLDVVFISPGPLMDSESGEDSAALGAVRLAENTQHQGPISYARLASVMQLAAADDRWVGKYVMPLATTKIEWKFKDLESPIETIQCYTWYKVLPAVTRALMLATLGTALGYILGVREGGQWPSRMFGWNLKA